MNHSCQASKSTLRLFCAMCLTWNNRKTLNLTQSSILMLRFRSSCSFLKCCRSFLNSLITLQCWHFKRWPLFQANDEGLTLQTSVLQIFHGGNLIFDTKFWSSTFSPIRYRSFFSFLSYDSKSTPTLIDNSWVYQNTDKTWGAEA